MFTIVLCLFCAFSFLAFGVAILIDPIGIFDRFGLALPDTASVRTELRAFYGGLEIGVGALMAFWTLRKKVTEAATLGFFAFAAVAASRAIGIVLEGASTPFLWSALALEGILAILLGVCLLKRN